MRGEVQFDDGYRALYATDASNYRQVPVGVVFPRDKEDIATAVGLAREHGMPVLARGGGTSLAGQCCNAALVMDMTRHMNHVLEIDPERRVARVQPGVILDDLRQQAGQYGLTFGPDPATHSHCTLGGMIGNNSCGVHSVQTGKTVDNVEALEILTYRGLRMWVGQSNEDELQQIVDGGGRRGEIYEQLRQLREKYKALIRDRYPDIPRRVSGYNLDELLPENGFHVARSLVGSECTCVTVLEATVRLVDRPRDHALLVLGYPDVYAAADHIPDILKYEPVGLEGIDQKLVGYMRRKELHPTDVDLLPAGEGWLLVEFGGANKDEADERAREVMAFIGGKKDAPNMKLYEHESEIERVWTVRESGLGATANVPGMDDTWPGWEDAAVHPDDLGDYLRDFRHLLNTYGYHGALYGHFGQGCVHVRIDFNLRTREGIAKYLHFIDEASDLVMEYGGSFSGEHGDGQSRGPLLRKMFGEELIAAFRRFKRIWDPDWKMNPGKVIDAYDVDDNLRLGTDFQPWQPETHFQFPQDGGSFAQATLRCVGVGKCRREGGGTMCPSYMITRDEKQTTRGRAHLLFEMLQGNVITGGWRDENVKEALDLCLSCKGCKGDCPVDVDIATYRAEFLSHYYGRRLRPRAAYAFGLIHWWARLAAKMPRLANFMTQAPLLRNLAKRAAGIAPQRQIPAFAPESFKAWYKKRPARNLDSPQVMVWPDTFNNYFHPAVLKAAVEVLEDAGWQVVVPQMSLCCGRPLYEWGMLNLAKRQLHQIIDTLRPEIRAGVPIVGLEPSCTAVFRDELVNLFPRDNDALRLHEQVYTLAEFLMAKAEDYELPRLERKAIVHGHCHHKAIMRMHSESQILEQMGVDSRQLDSGCCGMAGSFGFEKGERYQLSLRLGERVLLPAVRGAEPDTLILANGFSCREQVAQETERRALHLAQVIQMGLREGPSGPASDTYPEQAYIPDAPSPDWRGPALLAGLAFVLSILWKLIRGRRDR
ncbi:MAG TPA: FAD-linked oxidase C-terminal domain-containing protein [Candidatus Binatia bacterium]|nr:FAD-linked oxidase C-terminal domain-containing protein [Candidatus Binatia bacterium]